MMECKCFTRYLVFVTPEGKTSLKQKISFEQLKEGAIGFEKMAYDSFKCCPSCREELENRTKEEEPMD